MNILTVLGLSEPAEKLSISVPCTSVLKPAVFLSIICETLMFTVQFAVSLIILIQLCPSFSSGLTSDLKQRLDGSPNDLFFHLVWAWIILIILTIY